MTLSEKMDTIQKAESEDTLLEIVTSYVPDAFSGDREHMTYEESAGHLLAAGRKDDAELLYLAAFRLMDLAYLAQFSPQEKDKDRRQVLETLTTEFMHRDEIAQRLPHRSHTWIRMVLNELRLEGKIIPDREPNHATRFRLPKYKVYTDRDGVLRVNIGEQSFRLPDAGMKDDAYISNYINDATTLTYYAACIEAGRPRRYAASGVNATGGWSSVYPAYAAREKNYNR